MSIIEEEFQLEMKPITIFESILKQRNSTIELQNDISITYSRSKDINITEKIKNLLIQNEAGKNIDFDSILNPMDENVDESNNENDENNQGNIFSIKYKDIYIGGISPTFQMREGFGLNKYNEDQTFYVGQWKNNMKEGMGFLKIEDNIFYIGNFHQNQFDGDGILYLKNKNTFYIGHMSNGSFDEGVYFNLDNDVYYRGKFINNIKNDDNCTMVEMKNRHIFIGKVENDIFEKGYLCQYDSEEIKNGDNVEMSFNIEKIFYYYKDQYNNNKFVNQFENQFREVLKQNMQKIFEIEIKTKEHIQSILDYFDYLKTLAEDEDFNILMKYNEKDENGLLYIFINNYNFYWSEYQAIIENFNINDIKNEIDISQEIQGSQNE